jgi:heme exporter protein C
VTKQILSLFTFRPEPFAFYLFIMFLIPDPVVRFFHRMASPPHFYALTERLMPWLAVIFLLLLAAGLYGGLYLAPPDYQQGDSYRIIYIHVPSAWMSLFIYVVMAVAGGIGLVWRIKLAEIVAVSSAPVGAGFTFIALVTGSLWGKPMWGTWWVWDARLTSELILLFLYLGVIGLYGAIDDKRTASKAVAILALVGVVNIPIIHYSVEWWNTLHQGPTVTKMDKPSIHVSMLIPLLLMAVAFKFYYLIAMLQRARIELLSRERNAQWVKSMVSLGAE